MYISLSPIFLLNNELICVNINIAMKILKEEIANLKKELEIDFIDPIEGDVLKHFILNGSKFIRAKLVLLYLKFQNVEINNNNINKILAAGEIIHNASLLHDDVIDNADLRRNEITLAKRFSPKLSILAGDYLLGFGMSKLISVKNFEILELFKNCTVQMANAEIKQLFLRDKMPTVSEYIDICKGKTATLFATILESVALISDINKDKARKFGELFGICFQINNDMEYLSANQDKTNGVYTAKDVLGIEKTNSLLDNYKEEMKILLNDIPSNIYKKELEDLINKL